MIISEENLADQFFSFNFCHLSDTSSQKMAINAKFYHNASICLMECS